MNDGQRQHRFSNKIITVLIFEANITGFTLIFVLNENTSPDFLFFIPRLLACITATRIDAKRS